MSIPKVSGHAVPQYRERSRHPLTSSDAVVARAVACACDHAVAAGDYEDVIDEGRATRVIHFGPHVPDTPAEDMYALVRVDRDAPMGATLDELGRCVVITVLDREKRDWLRGNKWIRSSTIGDVTPPEVVRAVTGQVEPAGGGGGGKGRPPQLLDPGEWFLHYRAGSEWHCAFAVDRDELGEILDSLAAEGVSPDGVVVSRRVRSRARVVLEVEG